MGAKNLMSQHDLIALAGQYELDEAQRQMLEDLLDMVCPGFEIGAATGAEPVIAYRPVGGGRHE